MLQCGASGGAALPSTLRHEGSLAWGRGEIWRRERDFEPWVPLADWCLSGLRCLTSSYGACSISTGAIFCGHGWTQGKFGSVVAGGHPRDVFLIQRRPKPARYCRSGPFAFSLAKREGAGLDNDRAQVGENRGSGDHRSRQAQNPERQPLEENTPPRRSRRGACDVERGRRLDSSDRRHHDSARASSARRLRGTLATDRTFESLHSCRPRP